MTMNVLHRRTRSKVESSLDESGFSAIPFGDEGLSPFAARKNGLSSRRRSSFEIGPPSKSYSWVIKLVYAMALISWIAAYTTTSGAQDVARNLETQQLALKVQGDETLATLRDARLGLQSERKYVDNLKKTQEALYHEIRMVNEMFEAESSVEMPESPRRGSPDFMVLSWMEHRRHALENKIQNLKQFIQEDSRKQVVERYGSSPYRIKFTINISGQDAYKSFVMEMAPLELMPHSNHMFLEMVRMKLWDNTVFWHHDEVEHIIAAALFNYKTGEPKFHHLKALGFDGLHFAEYSPKFPHDKYTIGFSGKGPNIYINLQDNNDVHGPGGSQGHHDLPSEADPCFARIVEGIDVIDEMYKLSMKDAEIESKGREPSWGKSGLTQIVRVEIL